MVDTGIVIVMDLNDGHMYVDTWDWIDKHLYIFTTNGSVHTGWYKDVYDDNTYDWLYFDADGKMHCGWLQLGTKWYYMDKSDGYMIHDTAYIIDNKTYKFNTDGTMFTGWCQNQDDWYYFAKSGAMQKGWLHLGNEWYYMDEKDGYMNQDCWITLNGSRYHFDQGGTMHVGWLEYYWYEDDFIGWYYYHADGKEHHGWLTLNGKTYYMDPRNSSMYHSRTAIIDGVSYTFNADGTLK